MCAPIVIDAVRRQVSRRRVLGALGGAALGTVFGRQAHAQERPIRLPQGFTTVHDLTHVTSPQLPVYPAFTPIQITERYTLARDGFFANEVSFHEHTGTHLDAPIHFAEGGLTADQIPAEALIAPLAIVSITDRAERDPDAMVMVDDILRWESRHGHLPDGAFVAMDSGWEQRASDAGAFFNTDADGVMHFPGYSAEAALFLTERRNIVGVGVDTLSLDTGSSQDFVSHLTFLPAGIYGVELMANLGTVPRSGATIIVGGPKHQDASGGPARILAVF